MPVKFTGFSVQNTERNTVSCAIYNSTMESQLGWSRILREIVYVVLRNFASAILMYILHFVRKFLRKGDQNLRKCREILTKENVMTIL